MNSCKKCGMLSVIGVRHFEKDKPPAYYTQCQNPRCKSRSNSKTYNFADILNEKLKKRRK